MPLHQRHLQARRRDMHAVLRGLGAALPPSLLPVLVVVIALAMRR
jgi:hypothetical protein